MANEFVARNGVIAQNNSVVSGSLVVTNGITGSLFGTSSQALTASYILGGISAQVFPYSGSAQITGSLGVTGSINSTGNITTAGTLTAQTLVVQTITSSIEYSSGSNIFGSRITDTQTMTGSVGITGSLNSIGGFSITNDVSASFSTKLSFGPGTTAGSSLFLQASGSTNAFEIRPYGYNGADVNSYRFRQPYLPGWQQSITFDQPNNSISIASGNSDGGLTLSRPGPSTNETRLTSGPRYDGLPGVVTFYTSGSERVRIDGSGSLLVGTNTSNGYLTNINGANTTTYPNGALYVTGSSSFTGSVNVSGNITTTGTLTAQTLVVQTITSSITYSSGSNIFGNSLSNTQTFTGSVGITGSLTLGGNQLISGSLIFTTASTYTPSYDLEIPQSAKNNGIAQIYGSGTIWTFSSNATISRNGTGNQSMLTMLMGGTSSTIKQVPLAITGSWNQSGTAGYTILEVAAIENTIGTGPKLLQDWVVNGVSKASIDNVGTLRLSGSAQITGSLRVSGSISASGSIGVAIFSSNADSLVISGSLNLTGSFTQVGYQILTAVSQSFNYANDTAAAAGGIPLGGLYRTGNAIQIRLV